MDNNSLNNKQMRKFWIITAVFLGIVSCSDTADNIEKDALNDNKKSFTLIAGEDTSTKISVGDKNGDKYPILWVEEDALGLYSSTVGANITNERMGLTKGAGSNEGVFIASGIELAEGATNLFIYHPYNQYGLEQENGNLKLKLNVDQIQSKPGNSEHIGKYGFSYDNVTVPAGEDRASFYLKHPLAYIKFVVSTSELSSYKLQSVQLYDPSHEARLSGSYVFNTSTQKITVDEASFNDNARVSIEKPEAMTNPQEVYMTTFAADLSGKDIYAVVTFVDDNGATVTIPKKIAGKALKSSTLNIITLNNISESDNTVPWFETHETRLLAGGWAYGESNTVIIVGADSPTGNTVTISVKARGNFAEAREPKKVYVSMGGDNGDGAVLVNGYGILKGNFKTGDNVPTGDTDISSEYKITLHGRNGTYLEKGAAASAKGAMGSVVIYGDDKDFLGNPIPLWTFNVWVTKDEVKTHVYPSGRVVQDRNIGAPVKEAKDWWANGVYFQWGRTTYVTWGAGKFKSQPTSVKHIRDAVRLPNTMLYTDGVKNAIHDWYLGEQTGARTDSKDDLWGNPNSVNGENPSEGSKSIYDPCPKGFRVASPQLLKEVQNNWQLVETYTSSNALDYAYFSKEINGENAIWPFGGCRWGTGPQNRASNNKNYGAFYWSNSPSTSISGNSNYVYNMQYIYSTSTWVDTDRRTGAQPVRCMKDTDNR